MLAKNQSFSQRLVATLTGKAVPGFLKVLALVLPHEAGRDGPHLPPMQELMVHVHQVFMHEGVVAFQTRMETAGLEFRIFNLRDIRHRHAVRQSRVSGEHKNQTAFFPAGIRLNRPPHPSLLR